PTAMEPKGDALRDPPADDPASEALQQEVDQMLTDLVGNDWAGETPNPSENPTEELTDQHANNDLEIDAIPIPPLAGSEPSIAASNEAIDASEIPDQISPASVPTNDPPTPDPTNEQPWNQTADHRTASGTPPTQALEMPARASTSMIQSPTIELMTNQQSSPVPQRPQSSVPTPARIVSTRTDDFAMRSGDARNAALQRSGGDAQTQAAVESALRFLADRQQPDGSWSPSASAAGQERRVLGIDRGAVGARATNGITALALLTMLGAGNTHTDGPYASSVHAGVSYLIRSQRSDGFVGGNPSPLSRTYCHGMATLALCEIAAMTKDPLAVAAATAALNYSMRTQHHRTGGWRYTPGDTGDLSQLGWQAMALQSGQSADIPVTPSAISGIDRFLRSVRRGRGGLACYRPGEAPSRTMTAEALATRLLMRQPVPESEMEEATRYLLQQTPGVGQDNYYYWYYASLALHQVGGPGWMQWNQAMKQRLLQTQRADGSWNTASVWGGYGGEVYTTSMAALCLEVYYRHVEQGRLARTPSITLGR
ncbi:MAG: prenyltransferase/squalene oxidase repeat-containing protein, partial [Planctomycetota bacterium]